MTGAPGRDLLPQKIARYEIQAEIGRGMMGVVYRAQDPLLGRVVALKTIVLSFAVSDEDREAFRARFIQEARRAARLSHPGIVVIHDIGEDPDTRAVYITMEFLQGRTLSELVSPGRPLPWREALRITARVAEALDHAHSRGVIHRDIKPGNIILLDSGEPKIMDFGIAKIETARLKLTSTGQFFGTPLYMSPEQALGQQLDGRSDLFSLGAIAYNLLTAERAFEAANVPRILARLVSEDPPPPSQRVPGVPAEVDYLVARALAKAPADRFPRGSAFAEDIEDVLGGLEPRHHAAWREAQQFGGTVVGAVTHPAPDLDLDEILLAATDNPPGLAPDTATALADLVAEEPASPAERLVANELPGRAAGGGPAHAAARPLTPTPRPLVDARRSRGPRPAADAIAPRTRVGLRHVLVALMSVTLVAGGLALFRWFSADRRAAPTTQPSAATPPPLHAGAVPNAPTPAASGPTQSPAADASPATGDPVPEAASARPAPTETPAATSARLLIDFEHPLRIVVLRVWVDADKVIDEKLDSRVTKKVAGIKFRRGGLEEAVDVRPGKHRIRVQAAWDDNLKTEEIVGTFEPGQPRRMEVRIGRLRKNLSVEWK